MSQFTSSSKARSLQRVCVNQVWGQHPIAGLTMYWKVWAQDLGKGGPGHSGSLSNSCHGDSQLTQELIIFKSCIHSFSRRSDSEIETGAVNVGPASSDRGTLQGSMIWAKSYSTYKTLDKSAAQLCLKVAVIIRRLWPRLWQWDSVTSWYILLCWIWKWNFI